MSPWVMTAIVVGVSGIALWQRTTVGWIVAAIANAAAAWMWWVG